MPRTPPPADPSNGYEAVAAQLIAGRSDIGVATLRRWAKRLPTGASVLDLGCGHGVPISAALTAEGFSVHGVDASPTLVAEFRRRLPRSPVACEPVEDSSFFNMKFDAAIAVGLMFLLAPAAQRKLIRRVGSALVPGGRFLFTAPVQRATWRDMLTGGESVSLGTAEYQALLAEAGLDLEDEFVDEGENHYYAAVRV